MSTRPAEKWPFRHIGGHSRCGLLSGIRVVIRGEAPGAETPRPAPRASSGFVALVSRRAPRQACQRSTAPRPPAGPWSPSGTTSTSVSATAADRISASSARAGSGVLTPMARAWERCTAT
ncbi:hypothetical protein Strvi_3875 [Streptomyces violaceusniger Tu 4113]|uniref:Uncharacterized protein n=1 Tax=Streptomyces violaceusniger (strain Tu 4113) TaxID=653045 RepID=G2PEQ6_STRV4|nr:hypothetical protein Strvi_3875 [Streptomyces violaceusniger Tu 4113]